MKYNLINPTNDIQNSLEQILINRGISQPFSNFLTPSFKSANPYNKLDNIDWGVQLLKKHLDMNSNIGIIVDSDCDGYLSAAILWLYIKIIQPEANLFYLLHDGKEHGFSSEILKQMPKNTNLILSPDGGTNDYEEHKKLREMGIDIIVLDHHEADRVSTDAVIINNQLSENFPNKNLCGAAIVYKFCEAYDDIMGYGFADDFLDLVAFALVADMMDVRNFETQLYIQEGIKFIKNEFLKKVVEKQSYSLKNEVTPIGIAFYIVPLINALIRVGEQKEKEVMFRALVDGNILVPSSKRGHKPGDMEILTEQALRFATNAKSRQKKIQDSSVQTIRKIIEDNNLADNKILAIYIDEKILPKTLTGLVANKLTAIYKRPVLLLREPKVTTVDINTINVDDCIEIDEILLQGSARGYDKSDLKLFKDFVNQSNLFKYAEGK